MRGELYTRDNLECVAMQLGASLTLSADFERSATIFHIEMLPAENGDCLWIEYGDPKHSHRIVVDCGAKLTADILATRMKGVEAPLKLFVLTHIDADHINGVLPIELVADEVDGTSIRNLSECRYLCGQLPR